MDQREENLLARLQTVGRYLTTHADIVTSVAALSGAATVYLGLLQKLPIVPEAEVDAEVTSTSTKGATQAKTLSRSTLVTPTTAILNALQLYYRAQYAVSGNVEDLKRAAEMMLNRPAQLKDGGMPTNQFMRLLGRILANLDTLPDDALTVYNHDAAKIQKFRTLAGKFGAVATAPRDARDEARNANRAFSEALKVARNYIKSDLLPAVSLLADDNPEFVKGFRQANKQDDRRGGKKTRQPQSGQPE